MLKNLILFCLVALCASACTKTRHVKVESDPPICKPTPPNHRGKIFSIDPETGELTELGDLVFPPGHSGPPGPPDHAGPKIGDSKPLDDQPHNI